MGRQMTALGREPDPSAHIPTLAGGLWGALSPTLGTAPSVTVCLHLPLRVGARRLPPAPLMGHPLGPWWEGAVVVSLAGVGDPQGWAVIFTVSLSWMGITAQH